jgi:hypothetical protein
VRKVIKGAAVEPIERDHLGLDRQRIGGIANYQLSIRAPKTPKHHIPYIAKSF